MTSHFIYGPYTREASPTDRKPGCDPQSIFHLLRDRFGALIGGKRRDQVGYGGTSDGMTPIRCDIGQWKKHECTLM